MKQLSVGMEERCADIESVRGHLGTEKEQRERSDAALNERFGQLRAEFDEYNHTAAGASTAASGGSGAGADSSNAAVVIGSLSWNASAEDLVGRAMPLLREVLPEGHECPPIVPIVNQKNEGSAVETLLATMLVPELRVRVKALRPAMVAFLNAERRCGTTASAEELLAAVVQDMSCQIVFVSELDAHRDQRRLVADGWVVHRHYGGEGTCAMGWALRASAQRHAINMQWGHRGAGLELALPGEGRPRQSVMVLGLHAPYEAGGVDICAASPVQIIRERKRPGPLLVAGDWNIDPPPGAFRDSDVEARWCLWQAALGVLGLEARSAPSVSGRPPGPQASAAVATVATWCALREVGQMLMPRALDWVAVSPHAADMPCAKWDMRFADHACLFMKLPFFFAQRRRPPSKWRTVDSEASYAA